MIRRIALASFAALFATSALAQPTLVNTTGTSVLRSRESSMNNSAVVNVPTTGDSAPGFGVGQARGVVLLTPAGVPYSASGGGGGTGGNAAAGTTSSAVPTSADYTGFQNASGNLVGVSATNPLPTLSTLNGNTSNASSGQATSTTNVPVVSYNYGFNGTAWDRLLATAGQLQVLNYGGAGLFAQGTAAASATSLNTYVGGGFANAYGAVTTAAPAYTTGTSNSLSLTTTGALRVDGSGAVQSTTGFVGYNDNSASAVAASGATTPTARAAPVWASYYGCRVYATQAGTLVLGETLAGGALVPVATQTVAAATTVELAVRIRGAADTFQCVYTNTNATASTVTLASSFTAN